MERIKMKKIICVIDNSVKRSSKFRGEHGLSFWIETENGSVLFDTGSTGKALIYNLGLLDISPNQAVAVILSHAHNDHTGGLSDLLSKNPGLPIYASPDLFRPRYSFRNRKPNFIGIPLKEDELSQLADLRFDDSPIEVLPGLWTTGEISQRPEPEGRSQKHFVPQDGGWVADPYQDDMSMVMDISDGLVLICGCCHAGLLNTMAHVDRIFQKPIIAILGGTHLATADEPSLEHTISVLRDSYNVQHYYLNHCTGENAFVALAHSFGKRVQPCPAGTIIQFDKQGNLL
jgi:7,8-dihydropterin-6-yl-methyl-4-(beta-D-ribofuranosyl)aminobenzene 5'-phosphate synthase